MVTKMKQKRNYVYTGKSHPLIGIMSTILGVISNAAIIYMIYLVFKSRQEATSSYAMVVVLSIIYAVVGLGLAIYKGLKKDSFKLTIILGGLFNLCAICMGFFIIVVGC